MSYTPQENPSAAKDFYEGIETMQNLDDQTIQRMSQYLTTEHFTLQGARSANISEANGRLGHYLSIVGSGVVALAFVADVSSLGTLFLAFSAVIFPVLVILGLATMTRMIQLGIDYLRLTQAINRIHNFYLQSTPQAEPFFSFPRFDTTEDVYQAMMPLHIPFLQSLASTPGPVILINSILVGAFAGILAAGFFAVEYGLAAGLAIIFFALALLGHFIFSGKLWNLGMQESVEVRFPAPED